MLSAVLSLTAAAPTNPNRGLRKGLRKEGLRKSLRKEGLRKRKGWNKDVLSAVLSPAAAAA